MHLGAGRYTMSGPDMPIVEAGARKCGLSVSELVCRLVLAEKTRREESSE